MLLKSNSGESNVLRWAASKHSVRNHTSTTKLLLEVFNQTFESKSLLLHNSTSPMNWFSYLSAALDIGLKHQTTFIPVLKYTPACKEHIQVLKSLVSLKWRFKGEERLAETLLQLIANDFHIDQPELFPLCFTEEDLEFCVYSPQEFDNTGLSIQLTGRLFRFIKMEILVD